jgi:hypothetical protein
MCVEFRWSVALSLSLTGNIFTLTVCACAFTGVSYCVSDRLKTSIVELVCMFLLERQCVSDCLTPSSCFQPVSILSWSITLYFWPHGDHLLLLARVYSSAAALHYISDEIITSSWLQRVSMPPLECHTVVLIILLHYRMCVCFRWSITPCFWPADNFFIFTGCAYASTGTPYCISDQLITSSYVQAVRMLSLNHHIVFLTGCQPSLAFSSCVCIRWTFHCVSDKLKPSLHSQQVRILSLEHHIMFLTVWRHPSTFSTCVCFRWSIMVCF